MTFYLVLLAGLALLAVLGELVREVRHDGPAACPPRSHHTDPAFRSPASWS